MNMGRSSVGVTSCNGALYCGGGFGGRVFLNSVECYTPYDDTWKVVAPLACPRSCLGKFRLFFICALESLSVFLFGYPD